MSAYPDLIDVFVAEAHDGNIDPGLLLDPDSREPLGTADVTPVRRRELLVWHRDQLARSALTTLPGLLVPVMDAMQTAIAAEDVAA